MVARPITVVQMLPELNAGGVERGTLELGAYLTARGHTSIVISAGGRLVPALEQDGSRHISWRVGNKSPVVLTYLIPLRKLLVRQSVDILHVRSRLPAWLGYVVWRSIPKTLRPRFITTFHGFYSVNRYSAIMTKGERVIAISRGIATHIKSVYGVPEGRIVVIYRGIDENRFDPATVSADRIQGIRRQWKVNAATSPVIMLPARITEWKGQDVLIKSLSRLKALPWLAVCVGDTRENPSYTRRLQNLISHEQLENRVRFVGHCEDMPAAYLVADVVVSASSTEPEAFGRVAIEAQAMGKPVIATAHGGSLETVIDGESGRLVKPCDVEDLTSALNEVIQNLPLREKLGRRSRAWVLENFTVQRMCRETVALYLKLLDEE
jgi:glycosyltransferase involved in cell wall biosynthesis